MLLLDWPAVLLKMVNGYSPAPNTEAAVLEAASGNFSA